MLLRNVRIVGSLAAGALLCSCSPTSDITSFEPLVGAVPVAVSLQTSYDIPLSGLPRLQISPTADGVNAVWEVEVFGCLIQSATAARAGAVVEIRLERSGNPLANCAPVSIGYRYVARVSGLPPGQYQVRFVDVLANRQPYEIGRRTVSVYLYPPD